MSYPPKLYDEEAPEKDAGFSLIEKDDSDFKESLETSEAPASRNVRFLIWTLLNVASTVGIVRPVSA